MNFGDIMANDAVKAIDESAGVVYQASAQIASLASKAEQELGVKDLTNDLVREVYKIQEAVSVIKSLIGTK